MSRFSTKQDEHVNYEDEQAYKLDNNLALYSFVCNSVLQPQFYRPDTENQLNELRNLIRNCNLVFVAKLAVYAREKMFLRTIPLVLLVELARLYSHGQTLKKAVARTVSRPDEMAELLGYYAKANNRNNLKGLSKQLVKGLKVAANKFDEYQYAKWDKSNREISLSDVIRLVRPTPKDNKQSEIFKKLIKNELEIPYTWETEMAEAGRNNNKTILEMVYKEYAGQIPDGYASLNKLLYTLKALVKNKKVENGLYEKLTEKVNKLKNSFKKAVWEELIESGKLGYQAILMNLRNMLECDISMEHIEIVCNRLTNPKSVATSKMFPFRYLSAFRFVTQKKSIINSEKLFLITEALEKATLLSAGNLSLFAENDNVLIASDVSSSMWGKISGRGVIARYDIGLLLSILLKHKTSANVTNGIFGNIWKVKEFTSVRPLKMVDDLYDIEGEVGYSTYGWKVIDWCINNDKKFDWVVFFTDMQMYGNDMNNLWKIYKERCPNAKLLMFDLAGYGDMPLSMENDDVYLVSGWSNEIFNVLKNLQDGKSALANIEAIEL
jgi:hypothetical protein